MKALSSYWVERHLCLFIPIATSKVPFVEIKIEIAGHLPVLQIASPLNRTDMAVTETYVDTLLQQGSSYVVVDLTHTTFMDSYGLAVLLRIMKVCRQRGDNVLLVSVPDIIHALFELTQLNHVFSMYPNTRTALTAAT